MMMVYFLIRDF